LFLKIKPARRATKMELQEYEKMYKLEKAYWWFIVKRKIVNDNLPKNSKRLKLLDVGCGTGMVLYDLKSRGYDTYGLDIMPAALKFCKARGLKNLFKGSVIKMPFKSEFFDIVTCLDVLYHKQIKDDNEAIREIYRVLKPDGLLILTDAACPAMHSRHDIAAHVRERYTKKEICRKLSDCGFIIKKSSYFNTFLFPFVFVMRKIDNLINKNKPVSSDIDNISPFVNKFFKSIFLLESNVLKRINLPFGVSILCIVKKPKTKL